MDVKSFIIGVFTVLSLSTANLSAADSIGEPGRGTDGPNLLNNVYFGEQHLHTQASPDAFAFGTRGDANDAYKFARGEPITLSTTGETVQKRTP